MACYRDSFIFFTVLSEYLPLQPMNLGQPRHSLGMEGTQYAVCSQPSDGSHQQQKQKNRGQSSTHDSHLQRMQHYEPNHLQIDHIKLVPSMYISSGSSWLLVYTTLSNEGHLYQ
jgi:hypothetical protein